MSKIRPPKVNKKRSLQKEEPTPSSKQESTSFVLNSAPIPSTEKFVNIETTPVMPPPPSPLPREQERLGDILRRVREHRGESVKEIATYLCIRSGYLVALEESRYESLPADAYVIGFLKSYASYLELDEKGAIDQYRREMAGRRRKPQLSMPQPISEGRAPTIALLVGGLLAALIVYGIWYGLWAPDRNIKDVPISLPTSETEVIEEKENSSNEDNKPLENSSVFLETASMPKVSEMGTIIIEADPAQEKEAILKPLEIKENGNQTEEIIPKVFGAKDTFYVTLIAEKDSWILITDQKGLTVFDQTLKSGESYNVPVKEGLRLTTGNPSGINVIIKGTKMSKIKSKGRVARGVPLDPDKLKEYLTKNNEE